MASKIGNFFYRYFELRPMNLQQWQNVRVILIAHYLEMMHTSTSHGNTNNKRMKHKKECKKRISIQWMTAAVHIHCSYSSMQSPLILCFFSSLIFPSFALCLRLHTCDHSIWQRIVVGVVDFFCCLRKLKRSDSENVWKWRKSGVFPSLIIKMKFYSKWKWLEHPKSVITSVWHNENEFSCGYDVHT